MASDSSILKSSDFEGFFSFALQNRNANSKLLEFKTSLKV